MTIDQKSYDIIMELKDREYLGGECQLNAAIQCCINELLIALHESINSPKGTVPSQALPFFCQDYYNKELEIKND